jgi:hypothetical protein
MFASPKARRLHLIAAHSYPKEYFFAVTNKGIGGLLRRWGDGASLLRGQWHPRDTEGKAGDEDNLTEGEESSAPDSTSVPALPGRERTAETDEGDMNGVKNEDPEMDALARDVSALGLVPSSVRFGRGGTALRGRAGLATRGGRPAARRIGHPPDANHHHAVDNNKPKDKDKDTDMDMEVGELNAMLQHDGDDDAEKTPPTRGQRGRGRVSDGVGRGGRGMGRARGLPPRPPRGGFLMRGRGPRGMIAVRARGRGAGV